MLNRFLAGLAAVVFASAIAVAANLPLVTGAQDPSNLNATLNGVIQTINTSVSRIGVASSAVSSSGTTAEQTLFQYTVPPGLLANAGDSVRIGCWGTTGSNGNNKSMKLYFGTTATIATPSAATNNKGWRLEMTVMRQAAAVQAVDSWGLVDTTPVTPSNATSSETLASGVLIKCTATQGTASAGDVVGQGLLVEAIR